MLVEKRQFSYFSYTPILNLHGPLELRRIFAQNFNTNFPSHKLLDSSINILGMARLNSVNQKNSGNCRLVS